uniref:Citrate lyase subunit alpha n=1 Tax=Heterorhabditis bacteriophora TaxID=37862 RepID=A0A1I7WL22_HETBA
MALTPTDAIRFDEREAIMGTAIRRQSGCHANEQKNL